MEYGKTKLEIQEVVQTVGIRLITKMFGIASGGISTIATVMFNIAQSQNSTAVRSALRGTEYAFDEVAYSLLNSSFIRYEV